MTKKPPIISSPAHPTNFSALRTHNGENWRGICVHTTEDKPDGIDSAVHWFANPASNASTTFYVNFHGEIHQCVALNKRAWAQGVRPNHRTTFCNELGVDPNEYFISIEIEGFAATLDMSKAQKKSFIWLCRWLVETNSKIKVDRKHIVGHQELSKAKGDPGPNFDWNWMLTSLKPRPRVGQPRSINDRVARLENRVRRLETKLI